MNPPLPSPGGDLSALGEALGDAYRGRRVLVVGGDGFLGYHTTRAVLAAGARVTVLTRRRESLHAGSGCRVIHADLADQASVEEALSGQEVIFDLAGSSGGVESNRAPYENLLSDCAPHLRLFQTAAEQEQPPLIVFCSTRTVYGRARQLPVPETHPLAPLSIYAAHKAVLERHLEILGRTTGLPFVIFRLSNPYGPYPWQEGKSYGVINQFIHRAFLGKPLTIYGDGSQIRDYIYIGDVVRAFLQAAVTDACRGRVFNLGGPEPITMQRAAEVIQNHCPAVAIEHCAWPEDYEAIETGDYTSDLSRLREALGPVVTTTFADGVQRTLAAYRESADGGTAPPRIGPHRSQVGLAHLHRDFWDGRRVLVTGASGFLGSHLVKRLSQRGVIVGALHRKPLPRWLAEDPQVWSVPLDLTSDRQRIIDTYRDIRPDFVYHFASAPDGVEDEEGICRRMDCNIAGTLNLLCGAHRYPVRGFFLGDSSKVFGNGTVPHREFNATSPESSYAASKLAAWHACQVFMKAFGTPVAALRPTLIYGPGQAFNLFSYLFQCVQEGRTEILLDGGQQTRDPLFVNDAIHAYLRLAERLDLAAGRALPLGGGHEEPVADLARGFLASGGCGLPVRARPERIRPTEMLRSFCDNAEAAQALDWSPLTDRADALGQTYRYHQALAVGDGEAFLADWFAADFERITGADTAVGAARA